MPLHPQISLAPFDKWGLYFIGPIELTSHGKSYILVCIDYLIKWVEVNARDIKVARFLYEEIFCRYGVPREIVTDKVP